jgi:hypothetical protein
VKRFVAIAAAALAVGAAAPAHAARPADQQSFTVGDAAVLGPVHVRGDVAKVHVRYSCDVGSHLWVSVKQSASGAVDKDIAAEGSGFGGAAASWWQSHRGSFTCNGKRHVAWFSVDTVEPGSRGHLKRGFGWVQFCVTTEKDLVAVRMQWSRVVVNRR